MPSDHLANNNFKKILLITSSGGGGLIQTAVAKEQEIKAKNPSAQIVKVDLLEEWVFWPIGHTFVNFWNKAQMQGNVRVQTIWVCLQFLADIFLFPLIFFSSALR